MTDTMGWVYYNGHGFTEFTTGKWNYAPMTAAYCGDCAPKHLPGWNGSAPRGREHWDTGFSCGPWRVGAPCSHCGKDI